ALTDGHTHLLFGTGLLSPSGPVARSRWRLLASRPLFRTHVPGGISPLCARGDCCQCRYFEKRACGEGALLINARAVGQADAPGRAVADVGRRLDACPTRAVRQER